MQIRIQKPVVVVITLSWIVLAIITATAAENLPPNASFEQAKGERPASWATQTWQGKGEFAYAEIGRTGKRSVVISSTAGADVGWAATVAVRPQSTYRLSGWIKTENVKPSSGEGALFNLHNLQGIKTTALTGTSDWKQVETLFETGDNDSVQVNCLFGGWGLATGKAWYDDVALELVKTTDLKPAITIDASKTGEPVSKYIYGQFIEHLGRCIYGGIWAEMLEDRKFYYAVGAKQSPWEVIGGEKTVEMLKQAPFVGEQTPMVRMSGGPEPQGIIQRGLGLVKGKRYVGRIVVAGTGMPAEVSLVWGPGKKDRQTVRVGGMESKYKTTPLRFRAGATTDDGRLEIISRGQGVLRIGTVSLMPADNVKGMRADTLKLLKELDSPVYRWPGGNFVSGYNWRDGIGDPDKRPPRKNPAWTGVEHNDFGLDEFMTFCREIDTEPLIVVNSGQGDAKMAVEELEYSNGAPDTPMGKVRASNGRREPYNVTWWGIGNEMYGGWQLGHMPLEKYVKKNNEFADAMRKIDPSVKLVAVGALGRWSEETMRHCADHMDLISEHFYNRNQKGLLSHVRQIPNNVRRKAEGHRRYRREIPELKGKDIRISLDEWNYWYGPHVYGELGTRYFLRDALGIAAGLNEMIRNSDMFYMANYAQTVNVIGCIKTNKTAAAFATTGLPLKLYRREFGAVPVEVSGKLAPLDVAAAWTEDRKALTVAIVNPTKEKVTVELAVKGARLSGKGRLWQIAGDDDMAYNEPGKPPRVAIEEKAVEGVSDRLELAPISISLFRLDVR